MTPNEFIIERVWSQGIKTKYTVLTLREYVVNSIHSPISIIIDTEIKAPISNFMILSDLVYSLGELAPLHELRAKYTGLWSDIRSLSKYLKGNKAGPNQEEINWADFKKLYGWDDIE
jgi:hypothetical protein